MAVLVAQETPEVEADALAVLVALTRSLLLASMLVLEEELLDELEFEELEFEELDELEELVEGAAAELVEEVELEEPAPGMVS